MELSLSNTLLAGDQRLIDHIVGEVKSQGIFDQFRKECIADVDTKPAYQNLRTRVEGSVNSFLNKQIWKPDLNKNQLRETLRKHIHDAPYLDAGVERIVDQVVNPKVYSVFMSQIEDVVYKFLGVERPKTKEKNEVCGLKDLLPKDLDPVSPESDKNSLKDISLESVDTIDNLDSQQDDKIYNEQRISDEIYINRNKAASENGHISSEEKILDESCKSFDKTGSALILNTSGKSDDKIDEEEEDSPTFEPIDIMNLNESNMSNDSHLSGISELTSHRSRSPDFSNELSRDNFDYSNQDSQLSKVSSDSRLSIVTDFSSSNHGLTSTQDTSKEEITKDKYEIKNRDNFKAIREFDMSKNKAGRNNFEFIKGKDMQDYKGTKSMSSKENSRDATDSSIKDKYEYKGSKEKSKDNDFIKSKNVKEKVSAKDTKNYKDKNYDKKKSSSHSSMKYDKHSKNKSKDKIDQGKESSDKTKDTSENLKDNTSRIKDEKHKEGDKKDNITKEIKDLKDLYKEKIRELREKKELTEKEKLNKDKELKVNKEAKDKKDSPKDKKSYKKEHRSSSSSKNVSVNYYENKTSKVSDKTIDGKDKKPDSKDKGKRYEKRLTKDIKIKTHFSSKSDILDKSDKLDLKKTSKGDKDEKIGKLEGKKDIKASSEKINGKKDMKAHLQNKSSDRNEKLDSRKDCKSDRQSRERKRRDDKKSKAKDDHSSLRKNSNDRRSTDRDGSNGSNSKTTQSNNSNSNATSNKSSSSSLTKENHISNSSSETSDSIEEMQMSNFKPWHQTNCRLSCKTSSQLSIHDKSLQNMESNDVETHDKQEEADLRGVNLPLKKRPLFIENDTSNMKIKKPKFAKNIHEAKRLMKIRKQMEKQKIKENKKIEKKDVQETEQINQTTATKNANSLESMPDDERVQIIEIPDEEYDEPYPEKQPNLTLDERSIIMLGADPCSEFFKEHSNLKSLPNMEIYIRQSLSEIVSNIPLEEIDMQNAKNNENVTQSDDMHQLSSTSLHDTTTISHPENLQISTEEYNKDCKDEFKDNIREIVPSEEKCCKSLQIEELYISQSKEKATIIGKAGFMVHNEDRNVEYAIGENIKIQDYQKTETSNNNDEIQQDNKKKIPDKNKTQQSNKQIEMYSTSKIDTTKSQNDYTESMLTSTNEDNEDCRYFKIDNEKSEKFSNFLESLKLVENSSLEDIIESLGGKVVSSIPKSMAPPKSKRKFSPSPLSDILVNNSNNNNEGHKSTSLSSQEPVHISKKKKLVATKKQRFPNFCNPQGILNGENFVMPLSPESDVSATSEKTPSSNAIKEEKSRNRSSQRYSSDDLYKPRPLFSSSSRRSRRFNQA